MSGHTDTIMDALVPHDVLPPEIAEIQERLTIAAINGYSFETYEYVKALALDGIRDRATLLAVYKSQAEQIRDLKATIAHMEIHLVAASEIDIAVDREREACEKICTEWLRPSEMLLRAGEMTAQERRTATAILVSVRAAISGRKPT